MAAADALIAALDDYDQPAATFRALDAALAAEPGTILFTILQHDPLACRSRRIYTNTPHAYPVGGDKPITDSPWMMQVIHKGEPYLGRTAEDVADVFYDHALIQQLGCESVLNMPIRWAGDTIGTLNLLHTANHYTEAHIPAVRLLGQLAAPALLHAAH